MARPAVGPAFSLRWPQDLIDRVKVACKEDGMSRAEISRVAMEEYLARRARRRKTTG